MVLLLFIIFTWPDVYLPFHLHIFLSCALTFGSSFISYFMLSIVRKTPNRGKKGCFKVTLEHQELQVSSGVCRGCSIFQSRSKLESILSFRKVRKISVTGTYKSLFFSLRSLSRELYMLSIAMIHALYYVSQHTAPLLEVLPFTCYLISVIRGQWIQPKVFPWLISKQKPCIL